jgi:hypothetical protein
MIASFACVSIVLSSYKAKLKIALVLLETPGSCGSIPATL